MATRPYAAYGIGIMAAQRFMQGAVQIAIRCTPKSDHHVLHFFDPFHRSKGEIALDLVEGAVLVVMALAAAYPQKADAVVNKITTAVNRPSFTSLGLDV